MRIITRQELSESLLLFPCVTMKKNACHSGSGIFDESALVAKAREGDSAPSTSW